VKSLDDDDTESAALTYRVAAASVFVTRAAWSLPTSTVAFVWYTVWSPGMVSLL
jgi:hypothetical protein